MSVLDRSRQCVVTALLCRMPGFWTVSTLSAQKAELLQLHYESHREMVDGIRSEWLALSGKDFRAKRFPGGNWYLSDQPAAGASLTFKHRFLTDLEMDFSVYRSPVLIAGFGAEEIRSYLAKEQGKYAKRGLAIRAARAEKAPGGGMPFMGHTYWKVTYDLEDRVKGETKYDLVEYVTVSDDQKNYRLRFRGSPGIFDKHALATDRELSRFSLD